MPLCECEARCVAEQERGVAVPAEGLRRGGHALGSAEPDALRKLDHGPAGMVREDPQAERMFGQVNVAKIAAAGNQDRSLGEGVRQGTLVVAGRVAAVGDLHAKFAKHLPRAAPDGRITGIPVVGVEDEPGPRAGGQEFAKRLTKEQAGRVVCGHENIAPGTGLPPSLNRVSDQPLLHEFSYVGW